MWFELSTNGTECVIDSLFTKPAKAKSIRISQLGETPGTFWSIHELQMLGGGEEVRFPGKKELEERTC